MSVIWLIREVPTTSAPRPLYPCDLNRSMQLELIALLHQLLVLERKRTTQSRLTRIDRFIWVWV